MNKDDVDILARTIYGEARGEILSGQEAIASVVLNRLAFSKAKGKYWWGNSIKDICLKPWQFSCWNKNDVNYKIITEVDENNNVFKLAKRIAQRAVSGFLPDRTRGSTHYHTKNIRPKWSIGKIPAAEIGSHFFYNDIER